MQLSLTLACIKALSKTLPNIRQLWCRKWISIVVRRCLYTPAMEVVLPSIYYARRKLCLRAYTMPDLSSVVPAPRFADTIGCYSKKKWNPGENFFEKSSGQNPPLGALRSASPLGLATRFLSFSLGWANPNFILEQGSDDEHSDSVFLAFLGSKTQPNHWTKRMASTRLIN